MLRVCTKGHRMCKLEQRVRLGLRGCPRMSGMPAQLGLLRVRVRDRGDARAAPA